MIIGQSHKFTKTIQSYLLTSYLAVRSAGDPYHSTTDRARARPRCSWPVWWYSCSCAISGGREQPRAPRVPCRQRDICTRALRADPMPNDTICERRRDLYNELAYRVRSRARILVCGVYSICSSIVWRRTCNVAGKVWYVFGARNYRVMLLCDMTIEV